ncbi:MAG TPA: ATP-binding protein [Gemmatimonadales bacterium]|nr:ATP-binding protein [Gemmatimonadales bacterium]
MTSPARPTDHGRPGSGLAAGAVLSLALIAVGYYLAPPPIGGTSQSIIAAIGWTWSSAYAAFCVLAARRRFDDPVERRGLAWIAAGCTLWLLGQLTDDAFGGTWSYILAAIGWVGIYPCLIVAVAVLLRPQLRRDSGMAAILDTLLLTFMTGVLAEELLSQRPTFRDLRTTILSLAGGLGGVVLLWSTLVGALHRTRAPLAGGTRAFGALTWFGAASVVYAVSHVLGVHVPDPLIALGWDLLFLYLAVRVALAPSSAPPVSGGAGLGPVPLLVSHLTVLLVGLAGVFGVAILNMLEPGVDYAAAVLVGVGGTIIGFRLVLALRSDQEYAQRLERDVERQTRSLSASYAAAADAERNLRLLMDAVPDAIVVLDREGRVTSHNPPAEPLVTGHGEGGRAMLAFLKGAGSETAGEHLEAAFQGEVRHFEVSYQREDGRGVSAVIYAPIRSAAGIDRVIALARDISEQRRTEAQLQQSEKLAAMGQLVSGVAHEINNPAAIISGFAQTLLLDDLSGSQREMTEMIRDEAMRIGRITSNLLAFARSGGSERDLIDVNDVVRRTYALRAYHLGTLNIAVALQLDPASPVVWGNGPQLQQMLLNLLINAEQALADHQGERAITIRTVATPDAVRIEVADSGPGVPPDIQARIFDPFFTTKPVGVGTGLGLSICYGIVQEHGGRITLESAGRGATFVVHLPRDPRPLPRPATEASARPAADAAGLKVLIVDDEPSLREAARRFLNRAGMTADTAVDGRAALEALAHTNYDVIISDIRMPGMSGREFVTRLKQDRPDLLARVILSTGDTFAEDTSALVAETGLPTLVKPFDFDTLERMVRTAAVTGAKSSKS